MTAKTCQSNECSEVVANTHTFTPRIDVTENEEAFILYADVPGVGPENLEVEFEDGELTIHGKILPRQSEVKYFAREYAVGDFVRRLSLGESVDVEKIEADVSDGVLKVKLPKAEKLRTRKIKVNSS